MVSVVMELMWSLESRHSGSVCSFCPRLFQKLCTATASASCEVTSPLHAISFSVAAFYFSLGVSLGM